MVKKRLFANGPDFEWDLKIGSPTVVYFDQVVKILFSALSDISVFRMYFHKNKLKKGQKTVF